MKLPTEKSLSKQTSIELGLTAKADHPTRQTYLLHIFASKYADAGLASYTAGLLGAAAFMGLSLGPGWVGFFVGFLPVSLLTSWAIAYHD